MRASRTLFLNHRGRTEPSLPVGSKYHPTKGPEARLFAACLAAVLFPAGMFIYGWCAFPSVPWIGMAIGVFVSSLAPSVTDAVADARTSRVRTTNVTAGHHDCPVHPLRRRVHVPGGLVRPFS